MNEPIAPATRLAPGRALTITGAPDGFSGLVVGDLARSISARPGAPTPQLVAVCRDAERMAALARALAFFAPEIEALQFPAWDCLPYDRVSPNPAVSARRMATLARLVAPGEAGPRIVLTTINALLQRVPTREFVAAQSLSLAAGNVRAMDGIARWLEMQGFSRSSTVRDVGEFAVRGGILDLYAPGTAAPVRLDFFGDTIETIRTFDPETQRTSGHAAAPRARADERGAARPPTRMQRFRIGYAAEFGGMHQGRPPVRGGERRPPLSRRGALAAAVPRQARNLARLSAGRARWCSSRLIEEAAHERFAQINDYYGARRESLERGDQQPLYRPLPPERLYLKEGEWGAHLKEAALVRLSPFGVPDARDVLDAGGKPGRSFAPERADTDKNVFDAAVGHAPRQAGRGEARGLCRLERGLARAPRPCACRPRPHRAASGRHLGRDRGAPQECDRRSRCSASRAASRAPSLAVISEQDILGDRLVRPHRRQRRAEDFIAELTSLAAGDLVVHVDHGIGRFRASRPSRRSAPRTIAWKSTTPAATACSCRWRTWTLLSRYGSDEARRRARSPRRRRLAVAQGAPEEAASARWRRSSCASPPPASCARRRASPCRQGLYDEFCARFPWEETDDQRAAIDAVLDDLAAGRPMDRLVCGDVGFGKTEVALRAAFATAMNGKQVAVVVPTTLLARQHFKTFTERFRGLPVEIGPDFAADLRRRDRQGEGGAAYQATWTSSSAPTRCSRNSIKFKDLALVVVDEEQHFGVGHKERLKQLRTEVHVLTLTATPIPRTLQLALTGVRELSIIATPPVDRLAVRTFVTPFDPIVVREALLRERYRGGQAFYVIPRIEDIPGARAFLAANVPEVRVAVAHGQLPAASSRTSWAPSTRASTTCCSRPPSSSPVSTSRRRTR